MGAPVSGLACFFTLGFYVFMYFYNIYMEPEKHQNFIALQVAKKANNQTYIPILKEKVGDVHGILVLVRGICLGLFLVAVCYNVYTTGHL